MKELKKAKEILFSGGYTCVLCKGDKVLTSKERGVKPLVQWLETELDFGGFFAADKVVGRATAYLYVRLGVTAVYAEVISKPALDVLKRSNIFTEYNILAENIINRKGDDICPFEKVVLNIEDAALAHKAIIKEIKEMGI